MDKRLWEYMVYRYLNPFPEVSLCESLLNTFGSEGWELVSVAIDLSGYSIFYLKRPIPNS